MNKGLTKFFNLVNPLFIIDLNTHIATKTIANQ
jgi:hypothetical protein